MNDSDAVSRDDIVSRNRHSMRGKNRVPCPDCEHGTLQVSDGVYADCDNCDAAVLRHEVGL